MNYKISINLLVLIFFILFISCTPSSSDQTENGIEEQNQQVFEFPFQDPGLTISERVDDLIGRMTVEEKINQMMHGTPAIERLGVPPYNWWNESLHGIARAGRATVFPQAIGMAATFDPELIERVSTVISDEARAKYNAYSKRNPGQQYQGLTFWTPNINIFRDPRWGRGHETYGEDPYLTSVLGSAYVRGLQGDDPSYLKAAACAKHYAVHSGPEGSRHEFNAVVSMKDLWETYLPAFEALVTEAGVAGVMGAYNRTNGDPCNAHPYLMTEVLRGAWGFDGYYVSDCGAIQDLYNGHNVVSTPEEAAAMAVKAGTNLNCGRTYNQLENALEQGLLTEEDINNNLRQLLPIRFRLGLFDPPGSGPFDAIGTDKIRHPDHVALSREVAGKSIVMLKNKDNLLPLDKNLNNIFVTGPTATHIQGLLANYYGVSEDLVTIMEGIVAAVGDTTSVNYVQGALLDRVNNNPIDWYSGNARNADVSIVCLGISQLIEGEEGEAIASDYKGDRLGALTLPQNQIDFLKKIRNNGQKVVVVITGGSAIPIPEVYELADAVLFAWYPGEQGGHAIADVLFGDVVPSGKLPVTFPKSVNDLPPYENYDMAGRTYRYIDEEPLFPFGFGLSYSEFEMSDLALSEASISTGTSSTLTATITNKGETEADEVVQLYIKDLEASVVVPNYSLKGVKRVTLAPGESLNINFEITAEMLSLINNEGEKILEPGTFELYVGGNSPDPRNLALGGKSPGSVRLTVN